MTPQPKTKTIDADAMRGEFETLVNESSQIDETEENSGLDKRPFPILSDKALSGLPGLIVRTIEPHTEADNAAMLIQFLAGFGNLIGRTAYYEVGADKHFTKINAVIVGASATARKGTSWSEIERILIRVDESFINCVQNGLSSGEGLIHHVRDEQIAKRPIKKAGVITEYQDEIIDAGATEKRAFVIEPEFARVLQAMKREGNTLSSVIRQAWDTDRLRVMTKNPVKATGAHVSIVGHITVNELTKSFGETELFNGFANRYDWVCARRSKYLPDGGNLAESDLNEIVRRLSVAVQFAKDAEQIKRSNEANQLWHHVYKRLSDGYGGLLGSVTSRATAQVLRLACLYALLDCSDIIQLHHLESALAMWQYCEDSAKYIFGISSGDKIADEIFAALQSSDAGLSKTEISNHFNRNRTSQEIETALQTLIELNRIEKIEEKTLGRPREVFKAVTYEKDELNELSIPTSQKDGLNSFNSFNSSAQTKNKNVEVEQCPDCKIDLSGSGDNLFCEICFYKK